MAARLADVDNWLEKGGVDEQTTVEIMIDKLADLELKAAYERLFQRNPEGVIPPTVRPSGTCCCSFCC